MGMLRLDAPLVVGRLWILTVLWRPCTTLQHVLSTCKYLPEQRVLAFAKSVDGKEGLMLLTQWSEIGIFTNGSLVSAPFEWRDLDVWAFHNLTAIGENGT